MRVTWRGGVSIEYKDAKIILDPLNNRVDSSTVFITHAHIDHSKAFKLNNVSKFSSPETMDLASVYYPRVDKWQPLTPKGKVTVDDFEVVPHNSGHVLGSYEFEVATPDGSVLFTGDFNTEYRKTMMPAEPVECDILILEATFGSPHFVFPSEDAVARKMIDWAKETLKRGRIPTFQADSLGNAQEIIRIFNESTDIPIVTHRKVSRINEVYKSYGYKLDYIDMETSEAYKVISSREAALITPKQLNLSSQEEFVPALVSGWALWSKRKAFPLSDHADFTSLIRFVKDCNPKTVLTCHGGRFNETLARCIEMELKIRAYPIHLIPTNLVSDPS